MPHRKESWGFTLLEMMVSMAVLMVIAGGIITAINTSQQAYTRTLGRSDMYENVRGVAELMAQEIGQAGLVSLPTPSPTLTGNTAVGATTVNVTSTASMFLGEQLLIDGSANEEPVTIAGLTATSITMTALGKTHLVGAPITALGIYPTGIVPPGAADGSTATTLNLFGDINGDGTLVYVRYVCTAGTTAAPGTLTRSSTTIVPGGVVLNPAQNLLSTVVANPGATPCFQYSVTPVGTGNSVNQLGITLTVQTNEPDPKTGQYSTMTKSFLNLEPRNVMTGIELAGKNIGNRFQAQPTNVALY